MNEILASACNNPPNSIENFQYRWDWSDIVMCARQISRHRRRLRVCGTGDNSF